MKKSFSQKEKKARRQWQAADLRLMGLFDSLKLCPDFTGFPDFTGDVRKKLHARLDWHLNNIEAQKERAVVAFPEVEESFTIAKTTINLS